MASTNVKKNKQGYGYKYTDLAQIHEYLESNNMSYYQYVDTVEGVDYVYTVPTIDGKELPPRRGCRIVQATLSGKSNPAQEQGSALTYARRYSLLLAFGLATEDDDAECLTKRGNTSVKEKPGCISKDQMLAISSELTRTGIGIEVILEFIGKINIEDFTQADYVKVMKKLNITPSKEEDK